MSHHTVPGVGFGGAGALELQRFRGTKGERLEVRMSQEVLPVAVGLDLGGTSIKVGLVDEAGACAPLPNCPTAAHAGAARVLDHLRDSLDAALAYAHETGVSVIGLGVGTPGGVRQPEGVVVGSGLNIPGWSGTTVGTPLAEHAGGLLTVVDNDANAATLGEWTFGSAFGDAAIGVGITLGTGLGGGVLIDGHLLRGRDGLVGEFCHMGIAHDGPLCACGMRGCLEEYASIRGVERLAAEARAGGCEGAWTNAKGPDVVPAVLQAAQAGDAAARVLWERYGEFLGYGLVAITAALRPDVVVLFGGIAHAAEFFLPAVNVMMRRRTDVGAPVPVRLASLGDHAGVQGAAALAWSAYRATAH